jgi:hypothetical protein
MDNPGFPPVENLLLRTEAHLPGVGVGVTPYALPSVFEALLDFINLGNLPRGSVWFSPGTEPKSRTKALRIRLWSAFTR